MGRWRITNLQVGGRDDGAAGDDGVQVLGRSYGPPRNHRCDAATLQHTYD